MFRLRDKTSRIWSVENKITYFRRTLGIFLFISGVLLVLITPVISSINSYTTTKASESNNEELSLTDDNQEDPIKVDQNLFIGTISEEDKPKRIIIPKVDIDIEVKEAKVVNKKWEVFDEIASYGVGSGLPDKKGNIVIFAHARRGLFLPLREIRLDNEVLIFTKENWYSYKVVEVKEVNPYDISVITPTEDETLTLYTCSGFADSKRLIVIAKRSGT